MTPNMTEFKFGDVVLVPFPFTDQSTSKQRPAVVISSAKYLSAKPDLIIMAITSQLHQARSSLEVALTEWKAANLIKPSVIKPVIATLEKSLVIRKMGQLTAQDRAALLNLIAAVVGDA